MDKLKIKLSITFRRTSEKLWLFLRNGYPHKNSVNVREIPFPMINFPKVKVFYCIRQNRHSIECRRLNIRKYRANWSIFKGYKHRSKWTLCCEKDEGNNLDTNYLQRTWRRTGCFLANCIRWFHSRPSQLGAFSARLSRTRLKRKVSLKRV